MNIPTLIGRDAATLLSNTTSQPIGKPISAPRTATVALGLIALLALLVVLGLFLPGGWKLIGTMSAMAAFMLLLGVGIVHRWFGILINEKIIMSLSQFQIVSWTLVILSSYLCYCLTRIGRVPDPLEVSFDPQLLWAMGISATSFVAAPVILGTKKDKEPNPLVTLKTAAKLGESVECVDANRDGTLYVNSKPEDARFTDIFQGDEVGNTAHIDVAKVQMFFFTLVGVMAYAVGVFQQLETFDASTNALAALPGLPSGLVVSLAVSHAGYLASKGVDHTATQSAN